MTTKFTSENVNKYRDLVDAIKDNCKTEGATITEVESHGAYNATLPEGITPSIVKTLSKHNSRFVTAAHIASAELTTDIMKADPAVENTETVIGYFGDNSSINISTARSKTFANHFAKDEAEKSVTKQLVMKTTVVNQSARGHGLKSVAEAMSSEFADMFRK